MKKIISLLILGINICWALPKPMESIEKYNVLLVHGAYESSKGIPESSEYLSAYDNTEFLGKATLGKYNGNDRITKWLSRKVFEEPDIGDARNPKNSYVKN